MANTEQQPLTVVVNLEAARMRETEELEALLEMGRNEQFGLPQTVINKCADGEPGQQDK